MYQQQVNPYSTSALYPRSAPYLMSKYKINAKSACAPRPRMRLIGRKLRYLEVIVTEYNSCYNSVLEILIRPIQFFGLVCVLKIFVWSCLRAALRKLYLSYTFKKVKLTNRSSPIDPLGKQWNLTVSPVMKSISEIDSSCTQTLGKFCAFFCQTSRNKRIKNNTCIYILRQEKSKKANIK